MNRNSALHDVVSRMRLDILVTTAVKRALNPRPGSILYVKSGVMWLQHQRQYIDSASEPTCIDADRIREW